MKIYKITYSEGQTLYAEEIDAGFMDELSEFEVGDSVTIKVIEMSNKKYNSIPEFEGF